MKKQEKPFILRRIYHSSVKYLLAGILLLFQLNASAQVRNVTGTVTGNSGEAIPGVTVQVQGSTVGTLTDINGKYTLSIPAGATSLSFSFIGMDTKVVEIGSSNIYDMVLSEALTKLEEVVVVGYGTQKKATLTGSVSEIKGDILEKSPQQNISTSIAGKFTGVIVNNRTGEPGSDNTSLYVRGLATTGSNSVLVVIDGIPGQLGGLSRLDPNDIASITILKDASAAVYGSRAANGVILVTTHRGTTGKPTLNYSFNYGLSLPTRLPEMADAPTYAAIMNEIAYYRNPAGGLNQYYTDADIVKFGDGSDPLRYPNTDWAKESLRKAAPQSKHSITLRGGTDNLKYFVSLGALTQDGIYKKGVTKYSQYNVRSNIDADITDRLRFSLNISGRQEDRLSSIASSGTIFRGIYRAYPTLVAVYPNGLPSTGIELLNPVVMPTDIGGVSKNPQYTLNTVIKLTYEIPGIKGLTVDGTLALDKSWEFSKAFSEPYSLYSYNSTTELYTPSVTGGSNGKATLSESHNNNSLNTVGAKLNYEKYWNGHNVKALAGFEQSSSHYENFSAGSINYPTTETPELSLGGAAATDKSISGSSRNYTRRSFFGRISYDLRETYLFEALVRVDGSSIFPVGKQWGVFPGFSAGWVISKEAWFKDNIAFINNLKLRASYGQLGNDNVDNFQYFTNFSFYNRYVLGTDMATGINISKLANPNITWEVANKTDIGLEATFLKNFTLEAIYFQQKRTNILAPRSASIPWISGIVNSTSGSTLVPYENIGKINNSGIEITAGYRHTGDLSYNISANMTYAKSKVIDVDEASGVL